MRRTIPIVPASGSAHAAPAVPPIEGTKVELQLFTTLRCNLRCSYCSESVGDVRGSRGNVEYSIEALHRFIETHLRGLEVYVTFYGGEPTLNIDFMRRVMKAYPHFRYQLQTNGTLLHRLPDEVCEGLANVLVSVDGGRQTTDHYRGRGVYNRVMRNVAKMRGRIPGSFTARVTWGSPRTTLAELEGLLEAFDYLYFQFAHNDEFYSQDDVQAKRRVLEQLAQRFFSSTDELFPVIPLMGIVRNKAIPEAAPAGPVPLSQCRVSTNIVNVLPDGSIYPCPDMAWASDMRQGSLGDNTLRRSPLQPHEAMPCRGCEALAWCRHNCMKNLYVAYVQGDAAYRRGVVEPICDLVRFLGRVVDGYEPVSWLQAVSGPVRDEIAHCGVYDYVEVMP